MICDTDFAFGNCADGQKKGSFIHTHMNPAVWIQNLQESVKLRSSKFVDGIYDPDSLRMLSAAADLRSHRMPLNIVSCS